MFASWRVIDRPGGVVTLTELYLEQIKSGGIAPKAVIPQARGNRFLLFRDQINIFKK